ncbi:MAG: hypothetical protein AAF333_03410 [Planctomycetota bacterium]
MNLLPRSLRPTPCTHRRRSAVDARRRGSVLVLATVVVVLLAMMGAAFVQMSRLDRVATTAMDNRSQDYEGSILRYLAGFMVADIPEDRSYLEPEPDATTLLDYPESYDYPWTNQAITELLIEKSLRGTNQNDLLNFALVNGTYLDTSDLEPGEPAVAGGRFDDTWLASIQPEFFTYVPADPTSSTINTPLASDSAYWPHLTNLTGIGLDLRMSSLRNVDGAMLPGLYAIAGDPNSGFAGNLGDEQWRGTNVRLQYMLDEGDGLFGDADGDGIPDSRWIWAPLPDDAGLTYIMCVRIIDNSAMADVSTWTATSNGSADITIAEDGPRWYWPGDLDLRGSVVDNIGAAQNGDSVLEGILNDQRNLTGTAAGTASDPKSRYRNWLWASRVYGNPRNIALEEYETIGSALEQAQPGTPAFKESMVGAGDFTRYVRADEDELRWRNGLNRSNDLINLEPPAQIEGTSPTETAVTYYWRQAKPPAESSFEQSGYGTLTGPPTMPTIDTQAYWENNPRLRFTAFSGGSDRWKINLQHDDGEDISEKLIEDPNNTGMNFYPRVVDYGVWPDLQTFGDRAAAAVIDFRDTDLELESVGNVYGMEYLPFITEVFVQGRYDLELTHNNDGSGQVEWTLATDGTEVAIELINPWPFPIRLAEVELVVGSENFGTLEDLIRTADPTRPTVTFDGGDFVVLDGEELITLVIHDPDDTTGTGGPDTDPSQENYRGGAAGAGTVYEISGSPGVDWPENPGTDNAEEIEVVLRARASDGADVVYQQFKSAQLKESITKNYTLVTEANTEDGITIPVPAIGTSSPVEPDAGYIQLHTIGTGQGLSALTVRPLDLEMFRRNPSPDTTVAGTLDDYPLFGAADANADLEFGTLAKGQNSDSDGDSLDDRVLDNTIHTVSGNTAQAWLIGNTGVIYRAGDLARMVLLGPTTTQTVADVWHTSAANVASSAGLGAKEFRLTDFMIDPRENFAGDRDTRFTVASGPNLYHGRTTYGIELLNRVSTLSPINDGIDNDGDSRIDDDDENLIPGRININTASRDLLARALPFDRATDYASASDRKRTLIDLIVGLRQEPDRNSGSGRLLTQRRSDRQGIAWLGELLEALDGGTGSGLTLDPATGLQILPELADFNEYEQGDNSALDSVGLEPGDITADNLTGDREEEIAPLAALNQVAGVSSDVFTAYVEVRGYPATDFSQAPLEVYRLTAVFDRSVVHEARPLPLLRSVTVWRQP